LRGDRYDIVAKVPPGTTKEQLSFMLQNLLKERFKMTLHHEAKEQAVYEMVVGKNGSKLRDAAPLDPAAAPFRAAARDKDGFPDIPAGLSLLSVVAGPRELRLTARMKTVAELCRVLEGYVDRPILDKTGLAGNYDFKLAFSNDRTGGAVASPPTQDAAANPVVPANDLGLSFFDAVQAQLGLKLESNKASIDNLIIDHIDRVPTDN
jgi:uncharacterized protein (TIGR03435 family)